MKKTSQSYNKLKTSYDFGQVPYNIHPDPSFKRDNFTVLNGEWDFKAVYKGKSEYVGKIIVPFPPESELSGVKRITKKDDLLIYERKFLADIKNGQRLLLHFGAVDNKTEVFINGKFIGENTGGYISFGFDITGALISGENTLTVKVCDSLDKAYPYGKQRHNRGGMWYTPISGIWQTV